MTNKEHNILKSALTACRKASLYVAIFSCFVNLLMLTAPLYMLQVFDRVLASQSYDTLIYLTIIAITALLTLAFLDMTRSRVLVNVSKWLDSRLSRSALDIGIDEALLGNSYGAQALRDISSIRFFISGPSIFALYDAPWIPLYLMVIFLIHPMLGFISIGGAVLLFILAIINELATRKPLIEANKNAMATQTVASSALRNSEAIQAMGMSNAIINNWSEANSKTVGLQAIASNRGAIFLSMTKFIRFSMQITILGAGAYLVVQNQITAGMMIAASILMSRGVAPIEQAMTTWRNLIQTRQAYKRLSALFNKPKTREQSVMPLPAPKGFLSMEGVSFIPPGGSKPTLRNLNLKINPGEMMVVIGPSAAGKSTLARLLTGIWCATAGKVRLDNADLFTWNRNEIGKHIGYLPQDVELFLGSIKQNVARMDNADSDEIIKACHIAGVHEMILRLPEGYETLLNETATALSAGQRQRIALARALYQKPQLIVLDEPNSNLDRAGEDALLTALKLLRDEGRTIIVIAHRSNIINDSDKILWLVDGMTQAFGPKEDVLEQIRERMQPTTGGNPHGYIS